MEIKLTPTPDDSPIHAAQGVMAFMLSVIRCGEQLSDDEIAVVRNAMAGLAALKPPQISQPQIDTLIGYAKADLGQWAIGGYLQKLGIEVVEDGEPPTLDTRASDVYVTQINDPVILYKLESVTGDQRVTSMLITKRQAGRIVELLGEFGVGARKAKK